MPERLKLVAEALLEMRGRSPQDEKVAGAGLEGVEALEEFLSDIHRLASAAEKIQLSMARIESYLTAPRVTESEYSERQRAPRTGPLRAAGHDQ